MSEKGKEFNMPTFGGGVNAKELAIFTRQFSVMIDAGLPLVQCLEILAGQQENKIFQKVLTPTRGSVEGGATLSAAMRQHEKVFDALTSTWWRPARPAVFWTPFCSAWPPTSKRTSS